jgi:hypothetical protein
MDSVDVLNIVSHSQVSQSKLLEKLMYLVWYQQKLFYNDPILNDHSYNMLARKYYNEIGNKISTWDIPNRNIGDL